METLYSLSPLHHFHTSPSSFPLLSRLYIYPLNSYSKTNKPTITTKCYTPPLMASLPSQELAPQHFGFCKRRPLFIMGFSLFPCKLPAFASENEERSGRESKKNEQTRASSNSFLSQLNAIGLLSFGVLAAFYNMARKDKAASEAMIELLNNLLKEKDSALVSLEKSFESKLSCQEEEQNKLIDKAKDEKLSLVNHLESANSRITGLGQELQGEKHKIEQLQVDIEDLGVKLEKAGKEKDSLEHKVKQKDSSITLLQDRVYLLDLDVKEKEETIEGLRSSLVEKESYVTKLNSSFKKARNDVESLKSEILSMKQELQKYRNELAQKNQTLADLNVSIDSVTVERDNLQSELNTLKNEYDELRSMSEKTSTDDKKLLDEKESEIRQLKEKYELVVKEATSKDAMISDLTQDSDNLKKMLNVEVKSVQSLNQELQPTKETLESSKIEASDLNKQLKESRKHSSELEVELESVKAEFTKAKESLHKSLNEEILHSETLARELSSMIEALNRTKNELEIVSKDLTATSKNCDILQKESFEAYNIIESATNNLKEEQDMVASLNNKVQSLEEQILDDKEARISLETRLKEATGSLDQMNRQMLVLLKDLEASISQISSLKEESSFLNNSFEKEKKLAQESLENLEDAQSVIMKLGTERQYLQKKANNLEGELASAKGEIVHLRAQVNSLKTSINKRPTQEAESAVNCTTQPAKKTSFEEERVAGEDSLVNSHFLGLL